MSTHLVAQAFVLICMDLRLHSDGRLASLLHQEGIRTFDLKADAGAAQVLAAADNQPVKDWLIQNISISVNLHGIKEVVLINHSDCGAYGGSEKFSSDAEERQFHKVDLQRAAALVHRKFPKLKVRTFFAWIDGERISRLEEIK
ncbi:MAG: carbonic anhydrase [Patescibacteria group bacterium]